MTSPALSLDVDPVALGMTASGVTQLCDGSLRAAEARLVELRALASAPGAAPSPKLVVRKLDEVHLALRNASDFPQLMAVGHPDKAVRDAARACEPKVDALVTRLFLDAELAQVFRRVEELREEQRTTGKKDELTAEEARLLEHTLRDFRRNGLSLPPAQQGTLAKLNEELTKLGQDFEANISETTLHLDVAPAALDGLPDAYVAAHRPGPDGKVRITTDYPDYFPFVQYARDRKTALALYELFDNRAAEKNLPLLDGLLRKRAEKAKLLGYPTWADYVLETRMAKDAKTVARFLGDLEALVAARSQAELVEFRDMRAKLGGKKDDPIPPPDRVYLEDQIRKAKYGVDSREVSKYFEVRAVRAGILEITSRLFGISFEPTSAPVWHPDVEALLVKDGATGKVLGRFYFDLYPRADKYKHAAVFSIRETRRMDDGERLLPIAAIVCNFPKPGGPAPALMAHSDVVTFFHEFGHVLHHLLSQSTLAAFAGTSVSRDFVEAPSQMLEEWAWAKESLALFARHHETGAPLPDALLEKMHAARSFGRALATGRQLFLAALDQRYHTDPPGVDTTAVLQEVHRRYTPFAFVKGTHFQATFGHLVGYDAGYYGYQWALSIARDLFSRFEREGMMNEKTAREYRAAILEPGGSADEASLVARFLGRPSSPEAYKRFLEAAPEPKGAPGPR